MNEKMLKIGDKVKHKNFQWIGCEGTIIKVEKPVHIPFATANNIFLNARYSVKWDNEDYGSGHRLLKSELEKVS